MLCLSFPIFFLEIAKDQLTLKRTWWKDTLCRLNDLVQNEGFECPP